MMNTNCSNLSMQNGDSQHATFHSTGNDTTTSYEQSRRQISSVIISEELLEPPPNPAPIVYVEVPLIEEIIRTVPVRQIVEVEKVVPRYDYVYNDKIVEIPQIQYVDRVIEREVVQEVIRNVINKQIIDRPLETVRSIPKVEYVINEKIVNVPGEIIEIPRLYDVEKRVDVAKRVDKEVPVVVAQVINPVITESQDVIDVDIYEYIPRVIPVEVHVAKPVASHLIAVGATDHLHRKVVVPAAQFNTILKSLNSHLSQNEQMHLPYIKESNNNIPFLAAHETPGIVYPVQNAYIRESNDPHAAPHLKADHTSQYAYPPNSPQCMGGVNSTSTSKISKGGAMPQSDYPLTYDIAADNRGQTVDEHDSFAHTTCRSAASQQNSIKASKMSYSGTFRKRNVCNC